MGKQVNWLQAERLSLYLVEMVREFACILRSDYKIVGEKA
jgi:hypothetical protein